MLKLEKVNGKNVWDILSLKVAESQKEYVASNDTSIIEAYTAITGNGYEPYISASAMAIQELTQKGSGNADR